MASHAEIRGVLDYLLAHDEDDFMWGNDPFLCNRADSMRRDGQISGELYLATRNWIMDKIEGFTTLSQFHSHELGGRTFMATDPKWAPIRQSYLRKWIDELELEEMK